MDKERISDDKQRIKRVVIKKPENTYSKYIKKLKNFYKPLTQRQIEKEYGIFKTDFSDKVYPRLKKIGFIVKFEKSNRNIKCLFEKYGIKWKDKVKYYYLITPKTAKWGISLNKIVNKFSQYLEDKKELRRILRKTIPLMQKIELLEKDNTSLVEKEKQRKRIIERFDEEIKNNPNINWLVDKEEEDFFKDIDSLCKVKGRPKKQNITAFSFTGTILYELNSNAIFTEEYIRLYSHVHSRLDRFHYLLNQELTFSKILEFELDNL